MKAIAPITLRQRQRSRGVTLIELLLASALVAVLLAIAIPTYRGITEGSDNKTAIFDLKALDAAIERFRLEYSRFPTALSELPSGAPLDPWGNAYQYLDMTNVKGKGKLRKDKNLVPINSDYDLYSSGPDGRSVGPLTAKHSRDDIVRANNGGFFGLASDY